MVTLVKIYVAIIKIMITVFKHSDHLQKLLEELESQYGTEE